jgi:WD40 repeat protein
MASDSQGVIVWDLDSRGKLAQFSKNRADVNDFSISPDGKTLASVGNDRALRLWHLPSGQALFTLLQHSNKINWVKFASNNKLLIGAQLDANTKQGVLVFNAED